MNEQLTLGIDQINVVQKYKTILEWGRGEEGNLLNYIADFSQVMPPVLNEADYRFGISHYLCLLLQKKYPEYWKCKFTRGTDMAFLQEHNCSLKIGSQILQREKKVVTERYPDILTSPGEIMMRNTLGKNIDQERSHDFHSVLVINRGDNRDDEMDIGYAIIMLETYKTLTPKKSGGQETIKILNSQYDFVSKMIRVKTKANEEDRKNLDGIMHRNMQAMLTDIMDYKFDNKV